MKTLNKKEAVIISIGYIIFALIFSLAKVQPFSLVYFAIVALAIFFADKICPQDRFSLPCPLIVAFTAMVFHSTAFEIFYNEHINLNKLTAACAAAVFFAGIFAATSKKNFPYSVVAAPIICFLNLRISLCYCVLLACTAALNIYLNKTSKTKNSKKKANNTKSQINVNVIALVICVLGAAASVYLLLNPEGLVLKENFSYYINTFKNNPAVIIACGYLLIKLFKNDFKAKIIAVVGVVLLAATAVAGYFIAGVTLSVFACLCMLVFLSYCCIQDEKILQKIKEDYNNQTLLFWVLMLCLLR